MADNKGFNLVTERAKNWLQLNAGDWIKFEEMRIVL